MLWTLLKAHRGIGVLLVYLALIALGLTSGSTSVAAPLIEREVPLRLLLAVVLATLSTLPLLDPIPALTTTFVRGRPMRAVALLAVTTLYALTWLTLTHMSQVPFSETLIAAAIYTVVPVSVRLLHSAAWIAPLGVGVTLIFVDGAPDAPISRALAGISPALALGLCVVILTLSATLLYRAPNRRET